MRTSLFTAFLLSVLSSCSSDCEEKNDPQSCLCYHLYQPVCGCNDVTYENDCRANCAGIEDFTPGPCE